MSTTSSQQVIETKRFNLNFSKYFLSSRYPQPPLINLISEYKPYRQVESVCSFYIFQYENTWFLKLVKVFQKTYKVFKLLVTVDSCSCGGHLKFHFPVGPDI